jgi:flagellar protein FlaI
MLDKLVSYDIKSGGIPFTVNIYRKKGEFVPVYEIVLSSIGKTTLIILEKIREELINKVHFGILDIADAKKTDVINEKFYDAALKLVKKYFPDITEENEKFLTSYLVKKSLGLGDIELLMSDTNLEEIAINSSADYVWVYHNKIGWLKTNIQLKDENLIAHYASSIGRKVNRQISVLEPLMDATLMTGDRVNATLMPVSSAGNTITIRKFAVKPWTITDFLKGGAMTISAAALVWECVHYEMSAIIAGGTASGKTSMLNVVSNFFPPNQRIISIEDTREIQLPKFSHWVPMLTRLPNNEGKGGVSMLDLLVNSLRMRPDRFMPEKCTLPSGIACLDHKYTGSGIQMVIQNGQGFDMSGISVGVNGTGCNAVDSTSGPTLTNGQQATYTVACTPSSGRFKGTVTIAYTNTQTSMTHSKLGEVIVKVP